MKNLLFMLSLLLALPLYCFDTLVLSSKIASVQVSNSGTKVSNLIQIRADQGSYVLHLKDIPSTVNKKYIEFPTVEGLYILQVNIVKSIPEQTASEEPYQHHNDKVEAAYAELKALEKEEKQLLEEKRMAHEKDLKLDESERLQDYLHARRNAIKKERQDLFKRLLMLRENSGSKVRQISQSLPKFQQIKLSLFVSITLTDENIETIEWSYLLPSKSHANFKSKQEWIQNTPQNPEAIEELPASVLMRGKVIEQAHRAPMIFATLELYQNGRLIQSNTTDNNGEFSFNLDTKTYYDLTITFEGYKKKKVKNIYINQHFVPNQLIVMKVKEKVSVVEIVAYTLPLLDLARGFVK